jgi:hypothetical protein
MSAIGFIKTQTKKQEDISQLIDVKFTHACILGETGSGKTTSMINPNLDNRIKLGHGVLVFDHKGNYHTTVKALAKRHGRLDDVIVIGMPWDKKCNIVEDMDESMFNDFLKTLVSHKGEDKFWERSAISLAMPIWGMLLAIDKLKEFKAYTPVLKDILKKYNKSLTSLHRATVSRESISKFNKELDPLILDPLSEDKKINLILSSLIKKHEQDMDKDAYESIKAYMHFDKMYKVLQNELINTNNMRNKDNRTFDNIISSLNGPISQVAKHPYINVGEVNINKALNSGKIVVLLCNQLSEEILASITKSIFKNFHERIADDSVRDITIFVDEAQRVLNEDVDLPIDTIREARVDLFMAFQSKALLMEKLGQIKSMALDVNLTSKYYFKNSNNDDDMQSDKLKSFEFLTNKDNGTKTHKAKPLFLDDKELFDAEYEYQKMIKAFANYKEYLPNRRKKYILKFIPSIFDKNLLTIMYEDKKMKNVKISQKFSLKEFNNLKKKVHPTSKESHDALIEELGGILEDINEYK